MTNAGTLGWRRGFFRLWVLVSLLWILGIVALIQPWRSIAEFYHAKDNLERLPAAYAKIDTDIAAGGTTLDDGTVYDVGRLTELREKLKVQQTETEAKVDSFSGQALNFFVALLAPPIIAFAFGAAVAWVLAGFRRNSSSPK